MSIKVKKLLIEKAEDPYFRKSLSSEKIKKEKSKKAFEYKTKNYDMLDVKNSLFSYSNTDDYNCFLDTSLNSGSKKVVVFTKTHISFEILSDKTLTFEPDENALLKHDILVLIEQLKIKDKIINELENKLKMNNSNINDSIKKQEQRLKQLNKKMKNLQIQNLALQQYTKLLEAKVKLGNDIKPNQKSYSDLMPCKQYRFSLIMLGQPSTINEKNNNEMFYRKNILTKENHWTENKRSQSVPIGKIRKKANESYSLLFKPYDSTHILVYDTLINSFKVISFVDYTDFFQNFNCSNIKYINFENQLYIITGKKNEEEILYKFSYENKILCKLSKLNYNHFNGGLVIYQKKYLVCLSGNNNKKVEVLELNKTPSWNDNLIPEMNIDRSQASYLVLDDSKIYAVFGYSNSLSKYVNTVEYYSKEENDKSWINVNINFEEDFFGLKQHLSYCFNQNTINIFGGNNLSKEYIQIDLINKQAKYEKINAKGLSNYKLLSNGTNFYNNKEFYLIFDSKNNIHKISSIDNNYTIDYY